MFLLVINTDPKLVVKDDNLIDILKQWVLEKNDLKKKIFCLKLMTTSIELTQLVTEWVLSGIFLKEQKEQGNISGKVILTLSEKLDFPDVVVHGDGEIHRPLTEFSIYDDNTNYDFDDILSASLPNENILTHSDCGKSIANSVNSLTKTNSPETSTDNKQRAKNQINEAVDGQIKDIITKWVYFIWKRLRVLILEEKTARGLTLALTDINIQISSMNSSDNLPCTSDDPLMKSLVYWWELKSAIYRRDVGFILEQFTSRYKNPQRIWKHFQVALRKVTSKLRIDFNVRYNLLKESVLLAKIIQVYRNMSLQTTFFNSNEVLLYEKKALASLYNIAANILRKRVGSLPLSQHSDIIGCLARLKINIIILLIENDFLLEQYNREVINTQSVNSSENLRSGMTEYVNRTNVQQEDIPQLKSFSKTSSDSEKSLWASALLSCVMDREKQYPKCLRMAAARALSGLQSKKIIMKDNQPTQVPTDALISKINLYEWLTRDQLQVSKYEIDEDWCLLACEILHLSQIRKLFKSISQRSHKVIYSQNSNQNSDKYPYYSVASYGRQGSSLWAIRSSSFTSRAKSQHARGLLTDIECLITIKALERNIYGFGLIYDYFLENQNQLATFQQSLKKINSIESHFLLEVIHKLTQRERGRSKNNDDKERQRRDQEVYDMISVACQKELSPQEYTTHWRIMFEISTELCKQLQERAVCDILTTDKQRKKGKKIHRDDIPRISTFQLDFGSEDLPTIKTLKSSFSIQNNLSSDINYDIIVPPSLLRTNKNNSAFLMARPHFGTILACRSTEIIVELIIIKPQYLIEELITVQISDSKSSGSEKSLFQKIQYFIKLRVRSGALDACVIEVPASKVIDAFNQGNIIGSGSYGCVKKVLLDNKYVAVKHFFAVSLSDAVKYEEFLNGFRSEGNLLSKLQHKNIVSLLGICTDPSFFAIIMEYMPQGSLHTLISGPSRLGIDLITKIVIDICEGMCYLHAKNIVHRDLKSHNVLMLSTDAKSDVTAKISDFGTARTVPLTRTGNVDDQTAFVGSLLWSAPELLAAQLSKREKGKFSTEVDVYSLGVVIWEVMNREVSGRYSVPFYEQTNNKFGITDKIVSKELVLTLPAPLKGLEVIEEVMYNCLEYDPRKRPDLLSIVQILRNTFQQFFP